MDEDFTKIDEAAFRIAEERLPSSVLGAAEPGPTPHLAPKQDGVSAATAAEQMRKINQDFLKRQDAMLNEQPGVP